jgi:hypothetical protein
MSLGPPNAPHPRPFARKRVYVGFASVPRKRGEGAHRHLTFWMVSE